MNVVLICAEMGIGLDVARTLAENSIEMEIIKANEATERGIGRLRDPSENAIKITRDIAPLHYDLLPLMSGQESRRQRRVAQRKLKL